MKISWGVKIAAVYTLFVIGVMIMVFIFMNQDVSLVTDDYYAKGIKYQEQIEKMNRTKKLSEQLDIRVNAGYVAFAFPKFFKSNELGGTIHFFRPSDKTKDFTVKVETDTARVQNITTINLLKGLWKVKIDWNAKGSSFFNEKNLIIN